MADWTSSPHGPLTRLAPRVWQAVGELKSPPIPRAMTVWTMDDGGLWIHSAVNLALESMRALEHVGAPKVLVVPNGYHRMDAAAWKARYPDLRVVGPEAARAKVEEVVPMDAPDTDVPGVVVHEVPGIKPTEHVYEIDTGEGKGLVFCDAIFNLEHRPGFGGFLLKVMGSSGFFGMSRIGRIALLQDTKAFKGWLERQAARDDVTLVTMAHGAPVIGAEHVKAKLAGAAARL